MAQEKKLTWFNLVEKLKKELKELKDRVETLENA